MGYWNTMHAKTDRHWRAEDCLAIDDMEWFAIAYIYSTVNL